MNEVRQKRRYLVFTDLDGSLLDHDNYSWGAAREALSLLKTLKVPVIFNTSKTIAEVEGLQAEMGIFDPFISENGMISTVPENYFGESGDSNSEGQTGSTHYIHGQPYQNIRRILCRVREQHSFPFTGFGDCTVEEVAEMTGLAVADAALACDRKASEPLLWQGSEDALQQFVTILSDEGLNLTRGGRFHHVAGNGSKGQAVQKMVQRFSQHDPGCQWFAIGLGDGMNDLPMLEVVDQPVLIRSRHGAAPDVSHLSNILKTDDYGPRGWSQSIRTLFA